MHTLYYRKLEFITYPEECKHKKRKHGKYEHSGKQVNIIPILQKGFLDSGGYEGKWKLRIVGKFYNVKGGKMYAIWEIAKKIR